MSIMFIPIRPSRKNSDADDLESEEE